MPQPVSRSKNIPTRADDEIRTRDPHLGKVMRYHCATSACTSFNVQVHFSLRTSAMQNYRESWGDAQSPASCHKNVRQTFGYCGGDGRLAQLVARFLHTEEVIGSSPVSPTSDQSQLPAKKICTLGQRQTMSRLSHSLLHRAKRYLFPRVRLRCEPGIPSSCRLPYR